MEGKGTYALIICSETKLQLQVGRLGICDFSQGYYIYAGSALGGLEGRLRRHLRKDKKLHWHIDYLLQYTRIVEVWYCLNGERLECTWNEILTGIPGAVPHVNGFGSSDCRCRTHLAHFSSKLPFDRFKKGLKDRGVPEPSRLNMGTSL